MNRLNTQQRATVQDTRWPLHFVRVLMLVATAAYLLTWWSNRLSPEEASFVGKWGAIESTSFPSPLGIPNEVCSRELELIPNREVRLKVWMSGQVPFATPLLLTAPSALAPRRVIPPQSSTANPPPVKTPDSAKCPPQAEATGRWRVSNGQIHIDWDSKKSVFERLRNQISRYVSKVIVVSLSPFEHAGQVVRDADQLTINWKSRSAHFPAPPPQIWSLQSD